MGGAGVAEVPFRLRINYVRGLVVVYSKCDSIVWDRAVMNDVQTKITCY